jgi:hypothetical protein
VSLDRRALYRRALGHTEEPAFPAGHFLHLDGGGLELGIMRDSTVNSSNDYEVFEEAILWRAQIAKAFDVPRELILPIPETLEP